jgi:ribonuclease HI
MSAHLYQKQYTLLDTYSKMVSDTIESEYAKCAAEYILLSKNINISFITNILNRAAAYMSNEFASILPDSNSRNINLVSNESSPASYVSNTHNDASNINDFLENYVDCSQNSSVLNIFCEGTSTNIGTATACSGCGIYSKYIGDDGIIKEVNKKYILSNGEPASNQRAELSALYAALETLDKIKKENSNLTSFNIHITSKYAYTCVTDWGKAWSSKKWKRAEGPIKNVDIIRPLYEKLQRMPYVKITVFQKDKTKKTSNIHDGFVIARDLATRAISISKNSSDNILVADESNNINGNMSSLI